MGIFGFNFKTKRKKPLVLVADDDARVSDVFCEMLSRLNCNTVRASDGASALKLVSGKKPDLILLDVMMPQMSGISVMRSLKQNSDTRSIPVMIVSGEQRTNDVSMAFNIGAVDYLIKPVRKIEFDAKIKAALSSAGFPCAN